MDYYLYGPGFLYRENCSSPNCCHKNLKCTVLNRDLDLEVMLSIVITSLFLPFFTASAGPTATTVACEEKPEHHHSRSRGFFCPSSSYCPKCSHKSHSRSLVTWMQWTGGWGCCLRWCHKVRVT